MKKSLFSAILLTALMVSSLAFAGGDELGVKKRKIQNLDTLAAASLVSGDYVPVYDASADKVVKVDAAGFSSAVSLFEVTTATNVLTADECGKTLTLNSATEFVTTLPAPTAGCKFGFIVSAAPAGANYTIETSDDSETIKGIAFDMTGGAVSAGAGTAAADTITFVASTALAGDRVDLISDGTSWHGLAFSSASGSITYTSAH